MGKAPHGELLQSNRVTGDCSVGLPALTRMAVAAASPEPVAAHAEQGGSDLSHGADRRQR